MILITTSDYLPKLGGLTTFTRNIELTLSELGLSYEIFHWKSIEDIKNYDSKNLDKYDYIINIHVMFAWLKNTHHEKMINFIHGSEILFTSPNPIKALFKKFQTKKYLNQMYDCYLNVFISEATLEKIKSKGFTQNYSRDLIFHNCIPMDNAKMIIKNLDDDTLRFCCIVRNVPHKNLLGSLKFVEKISMKTNKKCKLVVPKFSSLKSSLVEIEELNDLDDSTKDLALQNSHFNLLLSLDHSKFGFYEGFGLTVLEAGKFATPSIVFNTGGLPESVHDCDTGIVISDDSEDAINKIEQILNNSSYHRMSFNCYKHTYNSHSINEYKRLFSKVFIQRIAS